MLGQWQQNRALLLKRVSDGPLCVMGDRPSVCDIRDPFLQLRVEVGQARESPRDEERMAQVLNGSLHVSLLVAPVRCAGLGREVVVPCELENARMKGGSA